MADRELVLAIDSSTSSTKSIVWDLHGRIVSAGRCPISYRQPRSGWAEQDPAWWWDSTVSATREALQRVDPARIVAVGLTWQRETWAPFGDDGKPLRDAIVWMDGRGEEELAEVRAAYGERFSDLTGKPLDVTPSLFKIMWLRKHDPEMLAETTSILEVGAFLTQQLTGEMRTCCAGADTMGLVDMRLRDWSAEMIQYAGLKRDQLPDLVEPGEMLGCVGPEGAQATGLLEGTPVIAGGGDGQCFAVGASALDGDIYGVSLGTGLTMNVHIPCYVTDSAFRTLIGCVPGSYLAEVNTRACSLIVQWFVQEFGSIDRETAKRMDLSVEELMDLRIGKIAPGSDGLLTLPHWRGAMMPHNNPLVRGATVGWSDYHTKAHFYRSILEGLAFEFRQRLEEMEQVLDQPCSEIRIGSGGSQSQEWCQIISDVTGKRIRISESPETTNLGAAMVASTAIGAFPSLRDAAQAMVRPGEAVVPNEKNGPLYDDIYNRVYVHLLPILAEHLAELRKITLPQA